MQTLQRIVLSFLCLFIITIQWSHAQEITDNNAADYQKKADSLRQVLSYDSASVYYQALSNYYLSKDQKERFLYNKGQLLKSLLSSNQFGPARQEAENFLAEINSRHPNEATYKAIALHVLGRTDEVMFGNMPGAFARYREAADLLSTNDTADYGLLGELYKDIGSVKFELNEADSSIWYMQEAVSVMKKAPEPDQAAIGLAYRQLSVVCYFIGQFSEGIAYAHQGLAGIDKEGLPYEEAKSSLYSMLGVTYKIIFELDSAYYYMTASQDINLQLYGSNDVRIAQSYQNLAGVATDMNNYGLAEELLEKARVIAIQNLEYDPLLAVYVYNTLSNVAYEQSNASEEAIGYLVEALNILGNMNSQRAQYIRLTALNNLGNLYAEKAEYSIRVRDTAQMESELQEGIQYMKQSLKQAEQFQGFPFDGLASFHINIGQAYMQWDKQDSAAYHFNSALSILKPYAAEIPEMVGASYAGLSELALMQENLKDFQVNAQKAEEYYAMYQGEGKVELIELYINAADRYLEAKDPASAEALIQKSHEANRSGTGSYSTQVIVSVFNESRILHSRAQAQVLYYGQSGDEKHLNKALEHYRAYSDFVKSTLLQQRNYKDLVSNIGINHRAYFNYARLCYELYDRTKDSSYLEEALAASQTSRSVLRKKSTLDKNLRSLESMPSELVKEEQELESKVAFANARLKQSPEDSGRVQLERELFKAEQAMREFQDKILERYPKYFNLKYNDPKTSLQQLRASLDPDQTLIEYFLDQETLLAFVMDQDKMELVKIELPNTFEQWVNQFDTQLKSGEKQSYEEAAARLYHVIFKPLKAHINHDRLVIIPDGSIWKINFDLLKDPDKTPDQYLLNEYAISYRYSSVVEEDDFVNTGSRKIGFAAFAFGEDPDPKPEFSVFRAELNDLPGSSQEVRSLSEKYRGEFLFGPASSEAQFKALAGNYSVLHLAIHGEFDERDYDNSKLYFKSYAQDSSEDNLLYPFELYNMDLNADLAVLSACNSGSGSISLGEGIMSLGRAFQFAGVNSLMLSKWEVSDGIAPGIVLSFYEYLDAGMTKDKALQQAKLDYIAQADNLAASPYYWGSFFLLGDTEPISLKPEFNYLRIVMIFCLFVISASWAFRARMRKSKTA